MNEAAEPATSAEETSAWAELSGTERGLAAVLSPEGMQLLNSLPPYDEKLSWTLNNQLRSEGYNTEVVAAALTQSRLRSAATQKFGEFAAEMLFTPDALEQATRLDVSVHHAQRFRRAGCSAIADLGCGIGGDAMAFAALGLTVTAVDANPLTAAFAAFNLQPFPGSNAEVGRAEDFDLNRSSAYWFDPARRSGARRIYDPEACSPPLSFLDDIAADARVKAMGAKMGPGISHAVLPAQAEAQWISYRGSVLECVLWWKACRREQVRRSALVISSSSINELTLPEQAPTADHAPTGEIAEYLYEPDGAVIRAGLVSVLAQQLHAHTFDPDIAFLTGDKLIASPFASCYRVREVLPFSVKGLKAYLRKHELGQLTIKKRGSAVEPDQLRKMLKPHKFGSNPATVILSRQNSRPIALIVDPM